MGAIRMHFELGKDDWDYGLVTLHAQIKIYREATVAGDDQCMLYFQLGDHHTLLKQLDKGEVLLSYSQTLGFIRTTDYIARMIVNTDQQPDGLFFDFVRNLTSTFPAQKDFEDYYLDYATRVLEVVNREFDKEPRLRGTLETFLFK